MADGRKKTKWKQLLRFLRCAQRQNIKRTNTSYGARYFVGKNGREDYFSPFVS
jgi:hypothetical protein